MNFVVYMKNKTGTPYKTLLGVFLIKGDADVFFEQSNWENELYSFHMDEVECWAEWSGIRNKLP